MLFGQGGFWGWFDPVTLLPVASPIELLEAGGTQAIQAGQVLGFTPPTSVPSSNLPNWLLVLNRRGGQTPAPPDVRGNTDGTSYDYDLWMTDNPITAAVSGGFAALPPFGGFGTTNLNMAFAANGDVYIVGLKARNLEVAVNSAGGGEPAHLAMVTGGTGFATSSLWRFRAFATPQIDALDLNVQAPPVPYNLHVTQPTDVVVYEPSGGPTRVLVAGSSSDALAEVTPTGGASSTWNVARFDAAAANAFDSFNLSGVMRGPRGLAIRVSPTTTANDVLVIYNFIEHSLTTLPLNGANRVVSASVPLAEPRPAYITANRKFLYSSRLSASNTASCASCHVDGHTDQLDWNLSDGIPVVAPFPLPGALLQPARGADAGEKGPMVTQSLRGLVNFELAGQFFQDLLLTNKPYHWRGDRGVFDHFNGAFIGLLGIPNPFLTGTASPLTDQGIPPGPPALAHMAGFREFVNSIHYPPNPEQPANRRFSGTLGNPNDITTGTLAQLGLKVFHSTDYIPPPPPPAADPFFACVSCHLLPEGSDNQLTDSFPFFDVATSQVLITAESLETAALRGLVQKEKRLFRRVPGGGLLPNAPSPVTTGSVGLLHTGGPTTGFGDNSIRHFVSSFVASPPVPNVFSAAEVEPVTLFVREFDTGVAPSIGLATTLTAQTPPADVTTAFVIGEGFANDANCGLIVQAEIGGTLFGFHYDPTTTAYTEVPPDPTVAANPPPFGNQTRTSLINRLVSNNRLILQCVPLGSERRVAYVHLGVMPSLAPQVPGLPTLQAMRPNTAYQPIPQITSGWTSLVTTSSINFLPSPNVATWFFERAMTVDAATAVPPFFGAGGQRHEAPRRFRVSGNGIRHGASLRVFLPNPADIPPSPPTVIPSTATHLFLEMPIHASNQTDPTTGDPIWETAVELDPVFYYGLMAGSATDVNATNAVFFPQILSVFNMTYPPGLFNPILRNWVFVQVVNQPGTANQRISVGSWQRMTL